MAVRSGLFPLYEVWDGWRYRINAEPDWSDPRRYLERQGRFSLDEIDLDRVRRGCRERWERLQARADRGPVTAS